MSKTDRREDLLAGLCDALADLGDNLAARRWMFDEATGCLAVRLRDAARAVSKELRKGRGI